MGIKTFSLKATVFLVSLVFLLAFSACEASNSSRLDILRPWETFQGNNAHTGFVPATLYPDRFQRMWEWERPDKEGSITPYINPVVIEKGIVYITEDDYHCRQWLYALDEKTGGLVWSYDFGVTAQLNPPAVSKGRVFVTTSGHEDTFLWIFDAMKGTLLAKTPFNTQWYSFLSPTIFENTVYNNSGYYGGQTIAASITDGAILWESVAYGDNDMFTPAVDKEGVYHYSGTELVILDRADGSPLMRISDPDPDTIGYSYIGATMRVSRHNIICFSGDNFSGQAGSSKEGYEERRLICFDLPSKTVAWKSISRYLTHPAAAGGQIFAASNSPLRLEALNEANGKVLWTWVPQNSAVRSFHRNIIATKNLIFVSSNVAVHAICRETHKEVWYFPEPGALSLSENLVLFIAVGARMSSGRLIAIAMN